MHRRVEIQKILTGHGGSVLTCFIDQGPDTGIGVHDIGSRNRILEIQIYGGNQVNDFFGGYLHIVEIAGKLFFGGPYPLVLLQIGNHKDYAPVHML